MFFDIFFMPTLAFCSKILSKSEPFVFVKSFLRKKERNTKASFQAFLLFRLNLVCIHNEIVCSLFGAFCFQAKTARHNSKAVE